MAWWWLCMYWVIARSGWCCCGPSSSSPPPLLYPKPNHNKLNIGIHTHDPFFILFFLCLSLSLFLPLFYHNMLTSALPSHSIRPTSHTSENTIPPNDTTHSTPCPHIRIVPHLESSRSLVFAVIERDVRENTVIKIGRFTDRFLTPNRITFRSKVVSRGHAELWSEDGKVVSSFLGTCVCVSLFISFIFVIHDPLRVPFWIIYD